MKKNWEKRDILRKDQDYSQKDIAILHNTTQSTISLSKVISAENNQIYIQIIKKI